MMFRKASIRNQKLIDEGTVNLRQGDFITTPIDPDKYDKVFCVNVIYFWSDLKRVFIKIHSMLRQNGLFCIFMISDKELINRKFAEEFFKHPIGKVEDELKKAGFKSVTYKYDKGYYIKAKK